MKRQIILIIMCSVAIVLPWHLHARDRIQVTGSSTVYPFATVVAEYFGRNTRHPTPVIESTGSGGGIKLFCNGAGTRTPDIANASRRMKKSELRRCHKNGVKNIIEVHIGYDGIVIAHSSKTAPIHLTRRQIYLALAQHIPDPTGKPQFVPNPYLKWSDVHKKLPNKPIRVYGPPPTSGTRDAFVELVLEKSCKKWDWIASLSKSDKVTFKKNCLTVREDGAYIDSGENDNLIIQRLAINPSSFGIFGFGFLIENEDKVRGVSVEKEHPSFESIVSGDYPISRSLYFYVKKAHIGIVPGLMDYVTSFVSPRAIGDDGYLTDRGLIPLNSSDYRKIVQAVRNKTDFDL